MYHGILSRNVKWAYFLQFFCFIVFSSIKEEKTKTNWNIYSTSPSIISKNKRKRFFAVSFCFDFIGKYTIMFIIYLYARVDIFSVKIIYFFVVSLFFRFISPLPFLMCFVDRRVILNLSSVCLFQCLYCVYAHFLHFFSNSIQRRIASIFLV